MVARLRLWIFGRSIAKAASEGCEDVALRTFDWNTTKVGVLLIEWSEGKSCGGDLQWCESFLKQHGMTSWGLAPSGDDMIFYSPSYYNSFGLDEPPARDSSMMRVFSRVVVEFRDAG